MIEVIVTPPPPVITKIALVTRFLDLEYVNILAAAKTDIEVEAWLDKFRMTSQVNLNDYRTKSGMEFLVSKGLLTEQRMNEILTAPVNSDERP